MTGSGPDTSVEEDQSNAAARRAKGEFVRGVSGFRHAIGDSEFPAEPGRYHLHVALNCPLVQPCRPGPQHARPH